MEAVDDAPPVLTQETATVPVGLKLVQLAAFIRAVALLAMPFTKPGFVQPMVDRHATALGLRA